MRLALEIVVVLGLLIVAVPLGLAVWTRRGEGRPDRPGERSVATFRGGETYATAAERELEEKEGPVTSGEGVARALADALRAIDVTVDAPRADDVGWGMLVSLGNDRAYVTVARTEDEEPAWILRILDPSGGGPGPSSVKQPIAAALRALDVRDVEWERR